MQQQIEAFKARFEELAEEAEKEGVAVVVALGDGNHNNSETHMQLIRRGRPSHVRALVVFAGKELLK